MQVSLVVYCHLYGLLLPPMLIVSLAFDCSVYLLWTVCFLPHSSSLKIVADKSKELCYLLYYINHHNLVMLDYSCLDNLGKENTSKTQLYI